MSFNVLVAQIKHETNTFSRLPTDLNSYHQRLLIFGDDVVTRLTGTATEIGGAIEAARRWNWSIHPAVAADATPGGKVIAACWRRLVDAVMTEIDRAERIDGVFLSLHGAMVTEQLDDAEGTLLDLIRDRLGTEVPIVATLDMHANVTQLMARRANALIAFRTFPHVDHVERALQAGELLQRAMTGEIRPRTVVARAPLLIGPDHGRTHVDLDCAGPMDDMLATASRHEKKRGILAVSVQAGFGWADVHDAGPTVAVVTDGNHGRAAIFAREMMSQCWKLRGTEDIASRSPASAIEEVRRGGGGPFVIADYTDNPGGGGYGDATGLLRAMLDAELDSSCLHAINDPEAVAIGTGAGIGETVTLDLGGKIDPTYGAPITVTGVVRNLTDGEFTCSGPMYRGVRLSHGPTMTLAIGGIDVIVTSHRLQTTDLQALRSQGVDPKEKKVVAVKSLQHFRAAFEPIARDVFLVNGGGLCDFDYKRFRYEKVRRPIWPLDDLTWAGAGEH